MTEPVLCALCRLPLRSAAARARQIGGRCWRKLRPDQRAAIRSDPFRTRAVLARPASMTDGQLPLTTEETL